MLMKFGRLIINNLKCFGDSQISFRSWDSETYICFTYLLIYLSLTVLGIHRCSQTFSSYCEWGLLFFVVHRPHISMACTGSRCMGFSSWGSHTLEHRLNSCGAQAQFPPPTPLRMWDLLGSGVKPLRLAL